LLVIRIRYYRNKNISIRSNKHWYVSVDYFDPSLTREFSNFGTANSTAKKKKKRQKEKKKKERERDSLASFSQTEAARENEHAVSS
jgi:hypothetical protein